MYSDETSYSSASDDSSNAEGFSDHHYERRSSVNPEYDAAQTLLSLCPSNLDEVVKDDGDDYGEEQRLSGQDAVERALIEYATVRKELGRWGIRVFGKMSLAKAFVASMKAGASNVRLFSTSRPKRSPGAHDETVRYTRVYLVGTVFRFFRWCQSIGSGVMLEECVLSDRPSYLHFDIEINKMIHPPPMDLSVVLEQHLKLIGCTMTQDRLSEVTAKYLEVSQAVFTEDQCLLGLCFFLDLLGGFLEKHLGVENARFRVLSGCRASKLSFHVICKDLLVDSNVCSMPLLVYEIGKHFAVQNLSSLYDAGFEFESELSKFHLRALMLESVGQVVEQCDENFNCVTSFGFRGYNDTPIDEAIYSPGHLLRAAGCCKPGGCALRPVSLGPSLDSSGQRMMEDVLSFSTLFPDDDAGFSAWCDHLILCPRSGEVVDEKLLCGMEPTPSCPFPRRSVAHRLSFSSSRVGTSHDLIQYKGPQFVEIRRTLREARRIVMGEEPQSVLSPSSHERIGTDDLYVGEDGIEKPFRLFAPGEWLFHSHGGVMERTASAKVFPSGFMCFGCSKSFSVPQSPPFEAKFEFLEAERVRTDDAAAYIGRSLDWNRLLEKKFSVISAPMGSGKTQKLLEIIEAAYMRIRASECVENDTVLIVAHRRFLAVQQASRLGVLCYTDISREELRSSPSPMLAIVINSLPLLSAACKYDTIILDEAGLIRRHLFSGTIRGGLLLLFQRLKELIRQAKHVILLQEGITQADVQFYTELDNTDSDDRLRVAAFSFEKPIVLHPIRMVTNLHVAISTMSSEFGSSIQHGVCGRLFMVFCSSAVLGEFLVSELRVVAVSKGVVAERVQGIWASVKDTPFAMMFSENPNGDEVASQVDVVVCTSVIGAGFSIDRHFAGYYAFLLTGILPFGDELQFVQRLRFFAADLPDAISRLSLIYVEGGRGGPYDYERVRINLGAMRDYLGRGIRSVRELDVVEEINVLAETQARVETERVATRCMHQDLWRAHGAELNSSFDEIVSTAEEILAAEKEMNPKIKAWGVSKRAHMNHLLALSQSVIDAELPLAEVELGMDIFVEAAVDDLTSHLDSLYGEYAPVLKEIVTRYSPAKKPDKLIMTQGGRIRHATHLGRFTRWMMVSFHHEFGKQFLCNVTARHYNSTALASVAHVHLCRGIFFKLFGYEATHDFVVARGTFPFFAGAQFSMDDSFRAHLRKMLEDQVGDAESQKEEKLFLRTCAKVVLGGHDRNTQTLTKIYQEDGCARNFIKKLLNGCGISLQRIRQGTEGRKYLHRIMLPEFTVACALCLTKHRDEFVGVMQQVLGEGNQSLSEMDIEVLKDGVEMFRAVCADCGVDPAISSFSDSACITRFLVPPESIADRSAESAQQIEILPPFGSDGSVGDNDETYRSEDRAILAEARALATAQHAEIHQDTMFRELDAVKSFPDNCDGGTVSRKRKCGRPKPNPYVLEEAGHSGSDSSDETDDDESSESSSSRRTPPSPADKHRSGKGLAGGAGRQKPASTSSGSDSSVMKQHLCLKNKQKKRRIHESDEDELPVEELSHAHKNGPGRGRGPARVGGRPIPGSTSSATESYVRRPDQTRNRKNSGVLGSKKAPINLTISPTSLGGAGVAHPVSTDRMAELLRKQSQPLQTPRLIPDGAANASLDRYWEEQLRAAQIHLDDLTHKDTSPKARNQRNALRQMLPDIVAAIRNGTTNREEAWDRRFRSVFSIKGKFRSVLHVVRMLDPVKGAIDGNMSVPANDDPTGIAMTVKHSVSCLPTCWLLDPVIDAYCLFLDRVARTQKLGILFSSAIHSKILMQSESPKKERVTISLRCLFRRTLSELCAAFRRVVLPFNIDNSHWCVAVLCTISLDEITVTWYDSMKQQQPPDFLQKLSQALEDTGKTVTYVSGRCPQQNDLFSCGDFVCRNMEEILVDPESSEYNYQLENTYRYLVLYRIVCYIQNVNLYISSDSGMP